MGSDDSIDVNTGDQEYLTCNLFMNNNLIKSHFNNLIKLILNKISNIY